MNPAVESREIRAGDLISVPTLKELAIIERATQLFARQLQVRSYHDGVEERLDAWFRHQGSLPDDYGLHEQEAVSQFRHSVREGGEKVFGPWAQVFNLSNPYLGVTIIHELSHLIDRYHLGPRSQWTSSQPMFQPLYEAYAQTKSCWIAHNARQGRFVEARGPGGVTVGLPRDDDVRKRASDRAARMLLSHEVFARCTTAFVVYESHADSPQRQRQICEQFFTRMRSPRNQISGYDLSEDDYGLIRQPLQEIFANLGWIYGRT